MLPKYEIVRTTDGSDTVQLIGTGVTFHSKHGAIQESNHVFIANGLSAFGDGTDVSIFEMGFGTGLNAFLSYEYALRHNLSIHYTSIESTPLPSSITSQLNYPELLGDSTTIWSKLHEYPNLKTQLHPNFYLEKHQVSIEEYVHGHGYDLIFFDAFGPGHQPTLWQDEVLSPLYESLKQGGMLVTFCAQGAFKRTLRRLGFEVEALPGPPGKREMTRAIKI